MSTSEQALAGTGRAQAKSIGRKILLRTLAIALPPLLVLAAVMLVGLQGLSTNAADRVEESRATLSEDTVVVASQDQAVSVAREINVILRERVADVAGWARSPELVLAASDAAADAEDRGLTTTATEELESDFDRNRVLVPSGPARTFLDDELENNPDFRQLTVTDVNGFNVASTARPDDFVQNDESWWTDAMASGLALSDVEYDAASGVFSVDIAVRIDDSRNDQPIGVLETSLSISFVQAITTERALDNVEYIVALADGRLIADTASDHASVRMMSLSFAGSAVSPGLGSAIAEDLEPGTSSAMITDEFVYGYTTTLSGETLDIGVDGFNGFDWIVLSSQPTEVALASLQGLEELNDDIASSGRNLTLVAALVLIAGAAAALLMARVLSRSIVRPIQQLTEAATTAAETGLPTVVDEINAEGADLEAVSAPSVDIATGDELETLASAFNSVQATAVRLASEQASSRRNTAEMFVNLGRRNQSLLKRQLRFIDSLEQSEEDPDTLESLFKLDHLATRMRRNAESLLVLAGDRSPRRWAAPVEVRTAVESALAEVESYERVDLSGVADGEMQGNVVADVAHILAEVIENGLNFSPPTAQVTVTGRQNDDEYILTVVDEGFGMKQDEIDAVNERLSTVTELTKVPSQYLGLFVVARLAQRHGITVSLSDAPSGGLSVRIVLPATVLHREVVEETPPHASAAAAFDALELPSDVTLDEDPEVAKAEAEVFELLAKAELALAKVEQIRSQRSVEEIAEEEAAKARRAAREVDSRDGTSATTRRSEDPVAPLAGSAPAATAEPMTEEESVDVGGLQFARRGTKVTNPEPVVDKGRRATDPAPIAADANDSAPQVDLAQFGFTRRESKRSDASNGSRSAEPARASSNSNRRSEDVEVVAEKSRNQWSSFQRGKQEAESETTTNREQ